MSACPPRECCVLSAFQCKTTSHHLIIANSNASLEQEALILEYVIIVFVFVGRGHRQRQRH